MIMDGDRTTTTKLLSRPFFFIISITIISMLYYMNIIFGSPNIILDISVNQSFAKTAHEQTIRCIVVVQERKGRLGNRMFLVASAYGLARLHSCHLYVTPKIINEMRKTFLFNLSTLLLSSSVFHSITNANSPSMNTTTYYVGCKYLHQLTRPNAIPLGMIFDLRGYWQSYLHFAKYADELRENVFVAKQSVLRKVSTFFGKIYRKQFGGTPQFALENHQSLKNQLTQSNLVTWIGIHIRRSDFIYENYSSADEYIFLAMQYYTSLYSNAYFLIASDDKSHCRKLFRNRANVSVTPRLFSLGDDLITLSLCQHSIVTGGTFGWWGAYLAHGRVLHDTVYPFQCERREHYYPPWYMIDGNVRAHIDSNYTL